MEFGKFETGSNIFNVIFFFLSELAEIIFVDTTPFVKAYFTDTEGHTYDWRGINSRKAYISNLLKVYY
jgi:tartrate-resistant acid phosphatase type 5